MSLDSNNLSTSNQQQVERQEHIWKVQQALALYYQDIEEAQRLKAEADAAGIDSLVPEILVKETKRLVFNRNILAWQKDQEAKRRAHKWASREREEHILKVKEALELYYQGLADCQAIKDKADLAGVDILVPLAIVKETKRHIFNNNLLTWQRANYTKWNQKRNYTPSAKQSSSKRIKIEYF